MTAAVGHATQRVENRTIGFISIGHAISHFYMLVLPPLFPVLKAEFDVSWAWLGGILTLSGVAMGVAQIPLGFLVDKIGARPVLFWGFGIMAGATMLSGLADSFALLLVLTVIAGLGNSVFHPADYAILSARIRGERLGRAFSIHLFASYIGWMIAPAVMIALNEVVGWRNALILTGAAGLVFLAVMIRQRDCIDDRKNVVSRGKDAPAPMTPMEMVRNPPILFFFLFFLLLALGGTGLHSFIVTSLVQLYDADLRTANIALAGFFAAGGIGILIGGYIADRTRRHEDATAVAYVIGAILIAAVAWPAIGVWGAVALLFLGGIFNACVSPSRDIMVRNISPPGQVGAVFGLVTTGFSVGGAIAPALFGWFNDIGHPQWVFWFSALTSLLSIVAVYAAQIAHRRTVR